MNNSQKNDSSEQDVAGSMENRNSSEYLLLFHTSTIYNIDGLSENPSALELETFLGTLSFALSNLLSLKFDPIRSWNYDIPLVDFISSRLDSKTFKQWQELTKNDRFGESSSNATAEQYFDRMENTIENLLLFLEQEYSIKLAAEEKPASSSIYFGPSTSNNGSDNSSDNDSKEGNSNKEPDEVSDEDSEVDSNNGSNILSNTDFERLSEGDFSDKENHEYDVKNNNA